MKVLNIELPDELTSIFYLWCDIVNYPKTEESFEDFIQDALLNFLKNENTETKIEIEEFYKHSQDMLCVKFTGYDWWIYSWDYDGQGIATWIEVFRDDLEKLKNENIRCRNS